MPAKIITEEEFKTFMERLFNELMELKASLQKIEQNYQKLVKTSRTKIVKTSPSQKFYTVGEVAEKIGQSLMTVKRLSQLDKDDLYYLKPTRLTKRGPMKFAAEDLEDYLRRVEGEKSYRGGKHKKVK